MEKKAQLPDSSTAPARHYSLSFCAAVIEEWGRPGGCVCMCGVLHLHLDLHLVLEGSSK